MSKISQWLAVGVIAAVAVSNTGCGPKDPPAPKTAKVSGTVTHNGKPVEGATVNFVPEVGSVTKGGQTNAEGKYSFDAVIGKNKISVTKTTGGGSSSLTEDDMKKGKMHEAMQNMAKLEHLLPQKYAVATNSGLTMEIVEDKENTKDLELTD